jgi:hypothetical protein
MVRYIITHMIFNLTRKFKSDVGLGILLMCW